MPEFRPIHFRSTEYLSSAPRALPNKSSKPIVASTTARNPMPPTKAGHRGLDSNKFPKIRADSLPSDGETTESVPTSPDTELFLDTTGLPSATTQVADGRESQTTPDLSRVPSLSDDLSESSDSDTDLEHKAPPARDSTGRSASPNSLKSHAQLPKDAAEPHSDARTKRPAEREQGHWIDIFHGRLHQEELSRSEALSAIGPESQCPVSGRAITRTMLDGVSSHALLSSPPGADTAVMDFFRSLITLGELDGPDRASGSSKAGKSAKLNNSIEDMQFRNMVRQLDRIWSGVFKAAAQFEPDATDGPMEELARAVAGFIEGREGKSLQETVDVALAQFRGPGAPQLSPRNIAVGDALSQKVIEALEATAKALENCPPVKLAITEIRGNLAILDKGVAEIARESTSRAAGEMPKGDEGPPRPEAAVPPGSRNVDEIERIPPEPKAAVAETAFRSAPGGEPPAPHLVRADNDSVSARGSNVSARQQKIDEILAQVNKNSTGARWVKNTIHNFVRYYLSAVLAIFLREILAYPVALGLSRSHESTQTGIAVLLTLIPAFYGLSSALIHFFQSRPRADGHANPTWDMKTKAGIALGIGEVALTLITTMYTGQMKYLGAYAFKAAITGPLRSIVQNIFFAMKSNVASLYRSNWKSDLADAVTYALFQAIATGVLVSKYADKFTSGASMDPTALARSFPEVAANIIGLSLLLSIAELSNGFSYNIWKVALGDYKGPRELSHLGVKHIVQEIALFVDKKFSFKGFSGALLSEAITDWTPRAQFIHFLNGTEFSTDAGKYQQAGPDEPGILSYLGNIGYNIGVNTGLAIFAYPGWVYQAHAPEPQNLHGVEEGRGGLTGAIELYFADDSDSSAGDAESELDFQSEERRLEAGLRLGPLVRGDGSDTPIPTITGAPREPTGMFRATTMTPGSASSSSPADSRAQSLIRRSAPADEHRVSQQLQRRRESSRSRLSGELSRNASSTSLGLPRSPSLISLQGPPESAALEERPTRFDRPRRGSFEMPRPRAFDGAPSAPFGRQSRQPTFPASPRFLVGEDSGAEEADFIPAAQEEIATYLERARTMKSEKDLAQHLTDLPSRFGTNIPDELWDATITHVAGPMLRDNQYTQMFLLTQLTNGIGTASSSNKVVALLSRVYDEFDKVEQGWKLTWPLSALGFFDSVARTAIQHGGPDRLGVSCSSLLDRTVGDLIKHVKDFDAKVSELNRKPAIENEKDHTSNIRTSNITNDGVKAQSGKILDRIYRTLAATIAAEARPDIDKFVSLFDRAAALPAQIRGRDNRFYLVLDAAADTLAENFQTLDKNSAEIISSLLDRLARLPAGNERDDLFRKFASLLDSMDAAPPGSPTAQEPETRENGSSTTAGLAASLRTQLDRAQARPRRSGGSRESSGGGSISERAEWPSRPVSSRSTSETSLSGLPSATMPRVRRGFDARMPAKGGENEDLDKVAPMTPEEAANFAGRAGEMQSLKDLDGLMGELRKRFHSDIPAALWDAVIDGFTKNVMPSNLTYRLSLLGSFVRHVGAEESGEKSAKLIMKLYQIFDKVDSAWKLDWPLAAIRVLENMVEVIAQHGNEAGLSTELFSLLDRVMGELTGFAAEYADKVDNLHNHERDGLGALANDLGQLEKISGDLDGIVETLAFELDALVSQVHSDEENVVRLESNTNELKNDVDDLARNADALQSEISASKVLLKSEATIIASLEKRTSELADDINKSANDISALDGNIENLERDIVGLREEFETQGGDATKQQLDAKTRELEAKKQEREKRNTEHASASEEHHSIKSDLTNKREDYARNTREQENKTKIHSEMVAEHLTKSQTYDTRAEELRIRKQELDDKKAERATKQRAYDDKKAERDDKKNSYDEAKLKYDAARRLAGIAKTTNESVQRKPAEISDKACHELVRKIASAGQVDFGAFGHLLDILATLPNEIAGRERRAAAVLNGAFGALAPVIEDADPDTTGKLAEALADLLDRTVRHLTGVAREAMFQRFADLLDLMAEGPHRGLVVEREAALLANQDTPALSLDGHLGELSRLYANLKFLNLPTPQLDRNDRVVADLEKIVTLCREQLGPPPGAEATRAEQASWSNANSRIERRAQPLALTRRDIDAGRTSSGPRVPEGEVEARASKVAAGSGQPGFLGSIRKAFGLTTEPPDANKSEEAKSASAPQSTTTSPKIPQVEIKQPLVEPEVGRFDAPLTRQDAIKRTWSAGELFWTTALREGVETPVRMRVVANYRPGLDSGLFSTANRPGGYLRVEMPKLRGG